MFGTQTALSRLEKTVLLQVSRLNPRLKRMDMPAQSKVQQKAAGAALAAKRGEAKVSELKGASKDMYASMSENELEELASTEHKNLPEKKTESN